LVGVDVDVVAGQVVPYVGAAVAVYGAGVLTRAEDAAADGTVRLGQRLLAGLLGRVAHRGRIEQAVTDLAGSPSDPDFRIALLAQVKLALRQDEALAVELAALLPPAPAAGERSVAVGGDNHGILSTGDGATNVRL
jgi:thioredoxin-like negative regulator of GroEL